jgi:hypothetical protein
MRIRIPYFYLIADLAPTLGFDSHWKYKFFIFYLKIQFFILLPYLLKLIIF